MTISSLAKKLIGVNNIKVENLDLEENFGEAQIVIRVRSHKRDLCRCGVCGRKCSRFDHGKGLRRWRAPDMGNGTMVFVEAEANRVSYPEQGIVVQQFPWARHKSRFTKNFEDIAVWLSLHLSRKAIAEYLRISWDTVGPIITRVEKELSANQNRFDNLVNIAIDETSYKKGHKYITLILIHDTNAVVSWCTEILDAVRREEWNKARIQLANQRKGEAKRGRGHPKGGYIEKSAVEEQVEMVKRSKYPLLMNPENLSEAYKAKLQQILLRNRRLATSYRLKEDLHLILKLPVEEAGKALDKWRRRAWSCRITQFVELQRKIKRHKDSILATISHGLSNARMEATNNKVKLTIRMAYGFRNIDNLISMIYLRCGNLSVRLPGRQTALT